MIPCIWYISHVHNWRRKWQPTPVFLPRESCGRKSLVSCCPKGHTELDMTEVTQHACMHWIRKWQPTPVVLPAEFQGQRTLVGSLYGDAQSQTRLKWLSSNNSMLTTRKKTEQALKNQLFFFRSVRILKPLDRKPHDRSPGGEAHNWRQYFTAAFL